MNAVSPTSDLTTVSLEDSISSFISNIKSKVDPEDFSDENELIESSLPKYISGINEYRMEVYIEAEIRTACLDRGSDPTEHSNQIVRAYGAYEDRPAQYISKELGGDGNPRNVFPLYKDADLTKWRTDQGMVYSQLKKGDGHWAKLYYGIIYSEKKLMRPKKIYYQFVLYSNEDVVCNSIEGTFENLYPKP